MLYNLIYQIKMSEKLPIAVIGIIVEYTGSDVYDEDVISHKWKCEMFFWMKLTCLDKIAKFFQFHSNNLNITSIIRNMDIESRSHIPTIDVLYSIFYKSKDLYNDLSYYLS